MYNLRIAREQNGHFDLGFSCCETLFSGERGLIEVLLGLQRVVNTLVDPRIGPQNVVVQARVGRVEPIDSSERLLPVLIAVRQAVEDGCIGLDAVPSLAASNILNKIEPPVGGGYGLMLVTVPLRHREIGLRIRRTHSSGRPGLALAPVRTSCWHKSCVGFASRPSVRVDALVRRRCRFFGTSLPIVD